MISRLTYWEFDDGFCVWDGDDHQVHETSLYITFVSTSYFLLSIVGFLNVLKATTHWNSYDMRASLSAKLVKDRVVQELMYFGCIFMCLNKWNVIILSCVALLASIFNLCVCVPFVLSMLQL
jgi:hypothetical protein